MPKSDSVLLPDVATLQLPIIGIPPVLAAASPRNLCRVAPDAKTSIQLRYRPRAVRAFIMFRNWLKFSQITCKCQNNLHLSLLGMMPSGGSHDTTHPRPLMEMRGIMHSYANRCASTVQGAAIQPHANGCHPASLERVRAAHLPCSPAGSNAIWLPPPSRAVRSSLRSMVPRIDSSMRLSSYRAMRESLIRGDNDPPSRESGQEDTLSSPETP